MLSFLARNSFINDKYSKYLGTLDPSRTFNQTSALHRNKHELLTTVSTLLISVAGSDRIGVREDDMWLEKKKNTFMFRK